MTIYSDSAYVVFQSTLPMRGVTRFHRYSPTGNAISIHTPHAGSDIIVQPFHLLLIISIHTPHAGSDDTSGRRCTCLCIFQSTLPMRGVTVCYFLQSETSIFQSTLPMRGVTVLSCLFYFILISIHTPHAGSDRRLENI